MKILFVGDLNEYGRSYMRFRTLEKLGHDVKGISMVPVPHRPGIERESLFSRACSKFGFPRDEVGANEAMWRAARGNLFDIVWVEKGNTIRAKTLQRAKKSLPRARFVNVSEDDMYARHNRSYYYTKSVPLYDAVFTTKVYNLEELKRLGAKRTELFLDSFDETTHRQLELSKDDKDKFGCDVGFIGVFEEDRAKAILFLH